MIHTIDSAERSVAGLAHLRACSRAARRGHRSFGDGRRTELLRALRGVARGAGYLVVTFDYRGIGLSAPASLRGYRDRHSRLGDAGLRGRHRLHEGAAARAAAVLGRAQSRRPAARADSESRAHRPRRSPSRPATVTGCENSWQTKRFVWWLWFVVVPLATAHRRLLSRQAPAQGRRSAARRDGAMAPLVSESRIRRRRRGRERARSSYASVRTPMLSLSFTDDEMMSEQGIRSLHGLYTNAPIEYRRIAPRDVGARRIGHFGFFRPQFEQTLWPLVPQWLRGPERKKITCAMSPSRTSASEMAQGDSQPPS